MIAGLSFHKHRILRHFYLGMRRIQNFKTFFNQKVTYVFRLFRFFSIFLLSFFSSSYLFETVIDHLLACFQFKISEEASSRRAIFTVQQLSAVAGNFALSFLSIFVHISGPIVSITLIWVSLERSVPLAELEYR